MWEHNFQHEDGIFHSTTLFLEVYGVFECVLRSLAFEKNENLSDGIPCFDSLNRTSVGAVHLELQLSNDEVRETRSQYTNIRYLTYHPLSIICNRELVAYLPLLKKAPQFLQSTVLGH